MDIDRDPTVQRRQMDEFLFSFSLGVRIVQYVDPTEVWPPSNYTLECDRDFYMGEAYLAGNQAHIALRRLERARDTFQGESAIPNFWTAVRLALAEAYGSVDVEAWDQALGCLKEILTVSPGEDRALALKARVLVRSGQRAAACDCAVQCLQSNPNNLEGLLYFAFLGFLMAKGAGNVNAMREAKHILIRAQSKCPGSIGMAWLLDICDIGIAEETDTA